MEEVLIGVVVMLKSALPSATLGGDKKTANPVRVALTLLKVDALEARDCFHTFIPDRP